MRLPDALTLIMPTFSSWWMWNVDPLADEKKGGVVERIPKYLALK